MALGCNRFQKASAVLAVVLACVLCAPCAARSHRYAAQLESATAAAEEEAQWFIQRLDHFNGAEARVWKQRYFVNDTFYRPGGPVFLMIGGEGPANPAWMQYGTWLLYAQKLGALCLLLEHRFYGKSHPRDPPKERKKERKKERVSLTRPFRFMNTRWCYKPWSRLNQERNLHRSKYLEVVWRSLAAENPECPLVVKKASDTLVERLNDPKTYDNITKDFRLCSKLQIQSKMDSAYLLESLAGNFMDVVQYNEDNRAFEGVVGTNITIKVLCSVMLDSSLGEPYDRYAAVARLMQNTFSQACINTQYKSYIQDMSNTSWSGPEAGGGRQWVYQTCTEFGFYQSTDSPNQPFSGFPLHYHLQQCADIYNLSTSLDDAIQQTNEEYGGYDIRTTRIVFPNGSIDPWHALGVTRDITSDLLAVFIKGTAHCANMYPARAEDLPQLSLARDHIFIMLQKWLAE
uniref:Putative serine protease K12H4.7 n=1 Tax=Sinocyclocheilus grahami TaxID=75366 RepID=A0A672NEF7_SINGR